MSLIYSGKSVGPRMEPSGAPALTGYFCKDFPSKTTENCPLLRKDKISSNLRTASQVFTELRGGEEGILPNEG